MNNENLLKAAFSIKKHCENSKDCADCLFYLKYNGNPEAGCALADGLPELWKIGKAMFKIGDRVIKNGKYKFSQDEIGKIWTVTSEMKEIAGTLYVWIDDKIHYPCDGLTLIERNKQK